MEAKLFFSFMLALLWLSPTLAFVGANRNLVILSEYAETENLENTLDGSDDSWDKPHGLSATTNMFFNAIYFDTSVLISGPLWNTIVAHRNLFDAFASKSLSELEKEYGNYKRFSTKKSVTEFREKCLYIDTLYKKLLKYAASSTAQECTTLILQDPAFSRAQMNFQETGDRIELSYYLLCKALPLDRFEIKILSLNEHPNHLWYLFIPKKVLIPLKKEFGSVPRYETHSEREQLLGLKIDHFKELVDPWSPPTCIQRDFTTYTQIFPRLLNKLFITKNSFENTQNHWAFYMMGHGFCSEEAKELLPEGKHKLSEQAALVKKIETQKSNTHVTHLKNEWADYDVSLDKAREILKKREDYVDRLEAGNTVAGHSLGSFSKIIRFFDEKLSTKLLFLKSCSAGGKQFLDAFVDENEKPLQLSFPVIADTLTESTSLCASPMAGLCFMHRKKNFQPSTIYDWERKQLALKTFYDFRSCFELASRESHDLTTVQYTIRSVVPVYKPTRTSECPVQHFLYPVNHDDELSRADINNLPSIRLPYYTYFSVIDGTQSFLSLTNNLHYNHCSLPITKNHAVIFLRASTICSSLSLENFGTDETIPSFVSMIPGKAKHVIDELYAPHQTLSALADAFFPFDRLNVGKLFHIKKLTCLHDNKPKTFYDVFLVNRAPINKIERTFYNGIFLSHDLRAITWDHNNQPPTDFEGFISAGSSTLAKLSAIKEYFSNANQYDAALPDGKEVVSIEEVCRILASKVMH